MKVRVVLPTRPPRMPKSTLLFYPTCNICQIPWKITATELSPRKLLRCVDIYIDDSFIDGLFGTMSSLAATAWTVDFYFVARPP